MSGDIKRIPIKDIRSEEGARELARSADMKPYLDFMMAGLQENDTTAQLKAITELPLERRYVWRIASALKWAFADFDDVNVAIDEQTLSPEDFAKVAALLRFRPIQFCMFLKALFGEEEMEKLMTEAVAMAKEG